MNDYVVLLPTGRKVQIRAHEFDVFHGVLVFFDAIKQARIAAFKEWVRIDRLT